VLYLIISLAAQAVLYIQLSALFVGVFLIVVYAGAILVLFLFVIMLLNLQTEVREAGIWNAARYGGFILAILLFFEIGYFGFKGFQTAYVRDTNLGTVEGIGQALFSKYVLPFEIASILLLVAMLGALYLSKRKLQVADGKKTPAKTVVEETTH
jgi:NADH-quinone oxidoreductase subunit J